MIIGGLDIGTTGCKITLYTEEGLYLTKSYRGYPLQKHNGAYELQAEAIFSSAVEVLREAASRVEKIDAIGVTSFGESFVLLDKHDRALRPAILYMDPRGEDDIHAFAEAFGIDRFQSISGAAPFGMFSLAKLLWIQKNESALLQQARRILLIEDYIVYMLTGVAQIDHSLAARTMLFDIHARDWSDTILAAANIDRKLLSVPVPSGTPAGAISARIAAMIGISPSTLIVSCAHDQIAATLGSGVLENGVAADGAGTVQCITPILEQVPTATALYRNGYAFIPYVYPSQYATYAYTFSGGSLIQWFVDTIGALDLLHAAKQGKSVYSLLEQDAADRPTGLFVLPHFTGAGTPYIDNSAKGAILGLSISTTRQDLYLATLEGVAYEMRLNIECLSQAGIPITKLHATGGGACSRRWLQIKSDITGVPIVSFGNNEAGTIGCIMLTGVAVGVFNDYRSAAELLIQPTSVFEPRREQSARYNELYQSYRQIYASIHALTQ